jgi:hypothetical protein
MAGVYGRAVTSGRALLGAFAFKASRRATRHDFRIAEMAHEITFSAAVTRKQRVRQHD